MNHAQRLADFLVSKYDLFPRSEQMQAAAELRRLDQVNAQLLEALHHISLCSQNSMSSQRQCGDIARAAIKTATGETK